MHRRSPSASKAAGVLAALALAVSLTACASTSDSVGDNRAPVHRENAQRSDGQGPGGSSSEGHGDTGSHGGSEGHGTDAHGDVTAEADVTIPALTGVDTQVLVDEGFVDALTTLGVTPGVVGTATFEGGSFAFPITGGNVQYWDPESGVRPYVQGLVEHDGSGISLTAGDTVVELTNFDIDPGTSELYGDVSLDGTVVAGHALLFDLHGGTLEPLRTEGTNGVLQGTTVHVSDAAADLLNEAFGTTAVEGGLLVGVATITVATQ